MTIPLTLGALIVAGLLGSRDADGNVVSQTISAASVYIIDGDTIDIDGRRYRLVGFDTPETRHAQCEAELVRGHAATRRLGELVRNGNKISLKVLPGRDRYNRGLAHLLVDGQDVGHRLISEGLARRYDGGRRQGWCG